jgi:NitT/TauT family transport system permease protein
MAVQASRRGNPITLWLKRNWDVNFLLGATSLTTFVLIWEFSQPLGIPYFNQLPSVTEVISNAWAFVTSPQYLQGWGLSLWRITLGFIVAQLVGVPLGLAMAMSRTTFHSLFPIVEMLRPIPPVAWIPMAVIFWPTRELSVISIVFLGAFWIVLLNTVGGASTIDSRYKQAALSLGSKPRDIFWKVIFPASLPSIITGMAVGMGIAWEMVVSAEMIAGDTGLGYLLWQSFEINNFDQVIVCMASIGLAGYASSAIIRGAAQYFTPWRKTS